MKRKRTRGSLPTDLYTAEAAESKKVAAADKNEPDPTPEQGERAIAAYVVEEDDGDPD